MLASADVRHLRLTLQPMRPSIAQGNVHDQCSAVDQVVWMADQSCLAVQHWRTDRQTWDLSFDSGLYRLVADLVFDTDVEPGGRPFRDAIDQIAVAGV